MRRILATLGWLALGVAFVGGAVHALQTGEALVSPDRGSSYTATRDSNPITFWAEVATGLLVGGLVVLAKLHTLFTEIRHLVRGKPPEPVGHPVPSPADLKPIKDLRSLVDQLPGEVRTDQEDADKRLVASLASPDEIPTFEEIIGKRSRWEFWGSSYRFPSFGPNKQTAKLAYGVVSGGSLSLGRSSYKIRNAGLFSNDYTLEQNGEVCAQGRVKLYGMVDQMRDALSATDEEFVSRAQEQETTSLGSSGRRYCSSQANEMHLSLVHCRFGEQARDVTYCILANGVIVGSIYWRWGIVQHRDRVAIQCSASVPAHLQLFLIWLASAPHKLSSELATLTGWLGNKRQPEESMVPSSFKCACEHCEGHLEAAIANAGMTVECPHCHQSTMLQPPDAAPVSVLNMPVPPATPDEVAMTPPATGKSWLTTFCFALFFGGLGVDRFYNGRIGLGFGKLLTAGACGIWSLVDVLLLLFKKYQDAEGNYLRPAKRSHMVVALSVASGVILLSLVTIGSMVQGFSSELASVGSMHQDSATDALSDEPELEPGNGELGKNDSEFTRDDLSRQPGGDSGPAKVETQPLTTTSASAVQQSLKFDGKDDRLELAPIDWQGLSAFTFEVWVRDWNGTIGAQGAAGDPENSIWLALGEADDKNQYPASGWESNARNKQVRIGPVPTNRWVHFAMVFDGKNQSFYLDGQLKNQVGAPRPGPFDMRRALIFGRGGQGLLRSARISSIARYNRNFQPAERWTTDNQTLLLLEAGNTLKDSSSHGRKVTIRGAPALHPIANYTNSSL